MLKLSREKLLTEYYEKKKFLFDEKHINLYSINNIIYVLIYNGVKKSRIFTITIYMGRDETE